MPDRRDMAEEIAQHLEDRYEELRAGGASDVEARRAVQAEIECRDGFSRIGEVGRDIRFGVRALRNNPTYAAVVALTLAIGIGANAAIFSVVNAVVFRPLPYPDADRIVVIWGNLHRPGVNEIPGSAGEYVDYRDRARAFDAVAAYDTQGFNLTGGGEAERVDGAVVTPTLFPLLGAAAELGRTFAPEEEQPARARVVVLSDALWRRRFNADPGVIGRTIAVDGEAVQVVGVMPSAFRFPDPSIGIWKPIVLDAEAVSENNRGSHGYTVLARMKAGVAFDQAQADVNAVAASFITEHPNNYRDGFSVTLRRLQDEIVGATDRPLLLLFGAVVLVLLIACANVANLQLARAASRQKEMALRTALGASRARLVQQLVTESLLISVLGAAAGLGLAALGVKALVGAAPDALPRLSEVSLDGRVVAFTGFLSLAAGLLFGVVPASRASGGDVHEALKEGGRGSSSLQGRAGRALVVTETALALVLLAGAGLLIHSFVRLQQVEPGFNPRNLLTFRLSLPPARYTTFDKGRLFFDELFRSVAASPSVRSVAAIDVMPFSGSGGSRSFYIEGREQQRPEDHFEEQLRIVSEGYFATMQTPVRAGREFTARDTIDAPRVAVVNQAFAQRHFGDGAALGGRVSFSRNEPLWYQIVGIVGDIKHRGLDAADRPELYIPYRQPLFSGWTVRPMFVVVRAAADPLPVAAIVRRALARIDPDQPISNMQTMEQRIDRSLNGRRFSLVLLATFAAFALALAAVGIYGVMAYSVAQRTHEIGVRLALGAHPGEIRRMVVRQGMAMTAIGAAIGLVAAFAATRVMSSLVFGIGTADPVTFAVTPLVLAAVAFTACYVPARRATRVEPVIALRQE